MNATLEQRERQYRVFLTAGNEKKAARLRYQVREFCSANNLPVPAWASQQRAKHGLATTTAKARQKALAVSSGPLDLPRALREWRSASPSRAVAVSPASGAVRLLYADAGEKFEAKFDSLEAAAAAVVPRIQWKRIEASFNWGHTRR